MKKEWDIDWEYWNAQVEGFKALKKKKKLWRDHKNENKEIVDKIYEWFWEVGE
tara:strand:+ start:376 stop:534 length:159 start_codon:yes stop_codon:yes gene_type:complete